MLLSHFYFAISKQVHQELKKARDSLKSATVKAPSELVTTMWEVDYHQALLAEDKVCEDGELGDLSSRVEELTLDEEKEAEEQKAKRS